MQWRGAGRENSKAPGWFLLFHSCFACAAHTAARAQRAARRDATRIALPPPRERARPNSGFTRTKSSPPTQHRGCVSASPAHNSLFSSAARPVALQRCRHYSSGSRRAAPGQRAARRPRTARERCVAAPLKIEIEPSSPLRTHPSHAPAARVLRRRGGGRARVGPQYGRPRGAAGAEDRREREERWVAAGCALLCSACALAPLSRHRSPRRAREH